MTLIVDGTWFCLHTILLTAALADLHFDHTAPIIWINRSPKWPSSESGFIPGQQVYKIGLRSNNRIVEMHNKWLLLTLSMFWHFHIFSEISFIKPDNLELWNELSQTWTHRFGLLTIFCGQKEKHYSKTSSIEQDWQPTVITLWTTK